MEKHSTEKKGLVLTMSSLPDFYGHDKKEQINVE